MKRFTLLLPVLAGILFGIVGLFVRSLTAAGLSNLSIVFVRMVLAVFMLLAFILIKDPSLLRLEKKAVKWVILCAVFGMFVTNLTFNVSSTRLSLSLAAVLLCLAPVYTVFISRILFHESITAKKIICMAFAILGCILVSGLIGSSITLSVPGILCGIISGVSYGLISIFSKFAIQNGTRSFTVTFYCLVILTIISAPFADYGQIGQYIAGSPAHVGFLLLHSLLIAVLPYIFLTTAANHIDPGMITILASSEPVAAMIVGILFYREIPTVLMVIGLFVTVIALILLCTRASDAGKD